MDQLWDDVYKWLVVALCAPGSFGHLVKLRMTVDKSPMHSWTKLSLLEAGGRENTHCLKSGALLICCIIFFSYSG